MEDKLRIFEKEIKQSVDKKEISLNDDAYALTLAILKLCNVIERLKRSMNSR